MQTLKIATACALLLTTLGLACSGQAAPLSYAQEKENTAKLVDIIDGATRDGLVAVLVPAPYVVHNGGPGVGSRSPAFIWATARPTYPGSRRGCPSSTRIFPPRAMCSCSTPTNWKPARSGRC